MSERNQPCSCGSGKRFKHCCGALGADANLDASRVQELMNSALSHQRAGRLQAADGLYRRALAVAPDNPDALHMLGAVCHQTGRPWEAFELINSALELTEWRFASMRYNLGLVIAQLMRDCSVDLGAEPHAAVRAASERLLELERTVEHYALDDDAGPLDVPFAHAPHVSIVIPAFDQHRFTRSCIRSIVRHTEAEEYEVVVVDDASNEPASVALANVVGLRIVRNESNLGFIRSCNRGAELARGDILIFLNNDTLVTGGWLTALAGALREPQVGLAGAKLVFPDGSLQEAGGIVWRNGMAANYGRNDDPGKPQYNYLRDADYCSGACLAIYRALFLALGGFDEHFAPAYYEDTDLAMRVRAAGKRVVYQPAATVVHFEGVSSGRDVARGVKRHQLENQAKFLERWRSALACHRELDDRVDCAVDRDRRARVLVVDAYLPVPDKDAGSARITAIMGLLVRAQCKVTFVAQSLEFVQGYGQRLQQLGVEVLHHPYAWSVPQVIAQRGAGLDIVFASRYAVASSCIAAARRYAPDALFVFDTVDLHFVRELREAELTGKAETFAQASLTRQKELDVVRNADITVVVSEAERATLAEAVPESRTLVLSIIHDVDGRMTEFKARRDIFFIGGFGHPPNVDAAVWYATSIWPLVRARLPDVTTYLIGSNMPERVRDLAGDGIEPLGHVPDLVPYLDGCRLSVAPLRFGAGVKGKISTAQARGTPVVATTLAAEGMFLENGRDVLVADDPVEFADAIVRLYSDAALWTAISDAGMDNVTRHFSRDVAVQALDELLELVDSRLARQSMARGPISEH